MRHLWEKDFSRHLESPPFHLQIRQLHPPLVLRALSVHRLGALDLRLPQLRPRGAEAALQGDADLLGVLHLCGGDFISSIWTRTAYGPNKGDLKKTDPAIVWEFGFFGIGVGAYIGLARIDLDWLGLVNWGVGLVVWGLNPASLWFGSVKGVSSHQIKTMTRGSNAA